MKRKRISILCVILTLAMVLSLTGCRGGDRQRLIGTWKCTIDLTDLANNEFDSIEGLEGAISIEDFKAVVLLEFRSDNTYSMWVDPDSWEDAVDKMIDDMTDDAIVFIEDMVTEQAGVDMSIEEILEMAGVTMDEMLEQIFPEDVIEELKTEAAESMSQEGKFQVKDGKLYTSAGLAYDVDPLQYESYTLKGSTLTLYGFTGDSDFIDQSIYPLTFTKQDR